MASKRERVVKAVVALATAALPYAEVKRNLDRPVRIPPGGMVIVRDGDPGPAEMDLSPRIYNYDHAIRLEIATYEAADKTREEVLDAMLMALGVAVDADRTLGGLCTYLDVEAAPTDDIEGFGADTARWADLVVVASYSTTNPLT